jgi:FkbM family methyltransferase
MKRAVISFERLKTIAIRGVLIPDDFTILSPLIRSAIVEGWYEAPEADQVEKITNPDDRVLEIGTGIGFISALLSRKTAHQILSYEANPQLIDFIRLVHEINGVENVTVVNAALTNGNSQSQIQLFVAQNFWASSTTSKPSKYVATLEVKAESLSHVVANFHPTMIVCDIEGGEFDLFFDIHLHGVKKILLEIHSSKVAPQKINRLFRSMCENNFVYDERFSTHKILTFQHMTEF